MNESNQHDAERDRADAKAELDGLAVALRRASDALLCAFMELNHIGLVGNPPDSLESHRAAAFLQIASAEINTRLNRLLQDAHPLDGVGPMIARPRLLRPNGGR